MNDYLSQHASQVLLGGNATDGRRCTATSKSTGERCGRSSAVGQFVCDRHGAKSPWSIQAGKERLLMLAEPALEALYRALRVAPPCETCGRSDADRDPVTIRAAQLVLDRCGFGPQSTVQVVAPDNRFSDMTLTDIEEYLEHQLLIVHEMREAEGRQLPGVTVNASAPVVDADIVENDAPADVDPPIHNAAVQFPDGKQADDARTSLLPLREVTRTDAKPLSPKVLALQRQIARAERRQARLARETEQLRQESLDVENVAHSANLPVPQLVPETVEGVK